MYTILGSLAIWVPLVTGCLHRHNAALLGRRDANNQLRPHGNVKHMGIPSAYWILISRDFRVTTYSLSTQLGQKKKKF